MASLPAIRNSNDQSLALPDLTNLLQQAAILIKSGLLPVSIKTPEQAVVIMLKGRELGLPPMVALEHVYTVKQKSGLDGQVIQALLRRDGHRYIIDEENMEHCVMRFWRRGEVGEGYTVEVTWSEATAAGWNLEPETGEDGKRTGKMKEKHTWRTMRPTMLMWRCLAKGARRYCSDSLCGTATASELSIDPDDELVDGEIVSGAKVRRDHALLAGSHNHGRLFKTERERPAPKAEPVPEEPAEGEFVEVEDMSELPAESEGQAPTPEEPHWIDAPEVRSRFWGFAGRLGLDEAEVYQALKTESMHKYAGDMREAKAILEQYAAAQAEARKAAAP